MTILPSTAASPILFQYLKLLPLGARGGVTRFFLLTQGIPFEEKLIPMGPEWTAEKKRLVESGENPSGSLPIVYTSKNNNQDDESPQAHPQHIAVSRYLARIHKVTSGDDYKDYVQDLVADEYQGWRDLWVKTTFSGSDEDKQTYTATALPQMLTKFNALYEQFKTDDVFLSVSAQTGQPLWGDAAIFGLLRDHVLTKYLASKNELAKKYPYLMNMYNAYESIPAVQKWLESVTPKEE